ncbi:hypothetical protein [Burkholderia gladioli]|uniref:hypothetical protein n=1 Tax=Burkholderia gladioli TaxID=28095 RepID=UPI00163EFE8B|nr:hypothetical protein [Burkholderia gladioli]
MNKKDESAILPAMNTLTKSPIKHHLLAATLMTALLTCGCTTNVLGANAMSKPLPAGAQAPNTPHPGTIVVKYAWNHSKEVMPASGLPESFIFRCSDADGNPTERSAAAWCIPVVEIETVSTDASGHPIAPKDAASITTSVYGPDHTFIEHVVSGTPPAK